MRASEIINEDPEVAKLAAYKALVKDLKPFGIKGKMDIGTFRTAKNTDAHNLEEVLMRAGWTQVKSGMYGDSTNDGVYEKNGVTARVSWYSTSSSLTPGIRLQGF
jgi:hypothetical protein